MSEIAQQTFNSSNEFYIFDMLEKRLSDKGRNWRHVLKSLKVLEYILHEGCHQSITWTQKNLYIIRELGEFQYIDEDGGELGRLEAWKESVKRY